MRALLLMSMALLVRGAERQSNGETCFLVVPFANGVTAILTFDNQGPAPRDITIQRFAATGKLMGTSSATVAGRAWVKVKVDLSTESPEFGWLRTVEIGGRSVVASLELEHLDGDTLTTIPGTATYRHPYSEGAVQEARQASIHHRYTYDVFALRGTAYFFVNLSEYPVQVGMCQANHPNCTSPSLDHTVLPMASIEFPVDQQERFLVLESSPGYSVAAAMHLTDGLQKVFGAKSSITFGPEETK